MKEYRIKAKSAEHRKAIIGALKGLGYKESTCNPGFCFDDWPVVGISKDTGNVVFWGNGGSTDSHHTSIDSIIEDIIRDRQTVTVDLGEIAAVVRPDCVHLEMPVFGAFLDLSFADFDRIAEAVAKVRGRV
jgi:hypothetical protein